MNVICVQNWSVKTMELSILAQRYVIVPLGSPGVTVLVSARSLCTCMYKAALK